MRPKTAVQIRLVVYDDAVLAQIVRWFRNKTLGYFLDEVAALSAVVERELYESACLAECRHLPDLEVRCEYRREPSGQEVTPFKRATLTRINGLGRGVVLRPSALSKCWML